MTSKIQTTLNFREKKNINFYGKVDTTPKRDFTNATCSTPTTRYTPTVKKLMVCSSSESSSDSDSDTENVNKKSSKRSTKEILNTPRRTRKSSSSEDEEGSTPPKQKKTVLPKTPSTMMDSLQLGTPQQKDKPTPKCLFPVETKKYQSAKKALHSAASENLPGREKELNELEDFIQSNLDNESSSSLYVSGPPGTGKTASLSKIMGKPELKKSFKIVYVNCTTVKSSVAIYKKISEELGIGAASRSKKTAIEKYLPTKHKMILLVLDEIDQLESKSQSVLYTIFEWPSIPKSKLLLIGIANALDLTDRILPRLQASKKLKPKLMHFASYSKQQIVDIITTRLNEANVYDIFTVNAIQMLAAKVAAISGDVRLALDISRRVVEVAQSRQLNQILQPAVDNAKNGGSPKKQQPTSEKAVDIKEVVAILNSVYGGLQNIDKNEDTFPLQQKLLLCSLILLLNKGPSKDVTIGKLHEVYKKVCKKRNIHAVDGSEFFSICTLISTQGILRVTGKKDSRLQVVDLQWDQEELGIALQDKKMMSDIIDDTSCL